MTCTYCTYPNKPRGPTPRENQACVVLNEKVMIYGRDSRNVLLSDLHMLYANTLRWSDRPIQVGVSPGSVCADVMAAIGPSKALLVGEDTGFVMSRIVFRLEISRRSKVDAITGDGARSRCRQLRGLYVCQTEYYFPLVRTFCVL